MPYKVLIVDDSKLARMAVGKVLGGLCPDWTCAEAANADEAIAILEARRDITIVFTDVQMPGSMDGLRLAAAIRGRWPPIKIIATSGNINIGARDLPQGGCFVPKPYTCAEIVDTINAFAA